MQFLIFNLTRIRPTTKDLVDKHSNRLRNGAILSNNARETSPMALSCGEEYLMYIYVAILQPRDCGSCAVQPKLNKMHVFATVCGGKESEGIPKDGPDKPPILTINIMSERVADSASRRHHLVRFSSMVYDHQWPMQ